MKSLQKNMIQKKKLWEFLLLSRRLEREVEDYSNKRDTLGGLSGAGGGGRDSVIKWYMGERGVNQNVTCHKKSLKTMFL